MLPRTAAVAIPPTEDMATIAGVAKPPAETSGVVGVVVEDNNAADKDENNIGDVVAGEVTIVINALVTVVKSLTTEASGEIINVVDELFISVGVVTVGMRVLNFVVCELNVDINEYVSSLDVITDANTECEVNLIVAVLLSVKVHEDMFKNVTSNVLEVGSVVGNEARES